MSSYLAKNTLSFLLFLAANCAAGAQQTTPDASPAAQLCGPDQLSGHYECVTSFPLSEEEVRVSLAHLAALKRLNASQPAPSEVAAREPMRR
jgi:hypothetical protein